MNAVAPHPRIVVLTAPSGAGKTTIARRVLEAFPQMRFSVSATTRPPRPNEVDGRDYHFVSEATFRDMIARGELLEYEEVYPGRFYGTPRHEVDAATTAAPVLLDVDVRGAMHVKEAFGPDALTIFVQPPSLEVLEQRLKARATETEATLRTRLERARMELAQGEHFDLRVVNDVLERAVLETTTRVQSFLKS